MAATQERSGPYYPPFFNGQWASTVKDPWHPCILSLDGGGIRSLSSLLILRALMHEIHMMENNLADEEDFRIRAELGQTYDCAIDEPQHSQVPEEKDLLPCHYFDFFYGTSSGGIVAILLGRLRMTIDQAIEAFMEIHRAMFSLKRRGPHFRAVYRHQPMEKAIDQIVSRSDDCRAEQKKQFSWYPEDSPPFNVTLPRPAQVCCLSSGRINKRVQTHPLRTYPLSYGDSTPSYIPRYKEGITLADMAWVIRASTALPLYFVPAKAICDGIEEKFLDGGVTVNNPSIIALGEFHTLFAPLEVYEPSLLLSIGTGLPDLRYEDDVGPLHFPLLRGLLRTFRRLALTSYLVPKYHLGEPIHRDMLPYERDESHFYKRLNVSTGLTSMRPYPDDTSARATKWISEATSTYLNRPFDHMFDDYVAPKIILRQTAEKAVRVRRAREAQGGPRWTTFRDGQGYQMPFEGS